MPRRPNLARDQKIADFVKNYLRVQGFAPTHRHIQKALKIDHLISVQRSLARLKENHVEEKAGNFIPLVGSVAAGSPIEAIENHEPIEVPAWMIKKANTYFVLRVRGNSMIEDGIFDEDLVLIRKQDSAKNGDTVVALINNEATLKRFFRKGDRIILKPANSELKPIEVSKSKDFRIAGICAGVLRGMDV
jgi:repressor LexA